MREIILQVNDDVDFEQIITLLAPFGKQIAISSASPRIWDDNMDWLGEPYVVDSFKPLGRDEIYTRELKRLPEIRLLGARACREPPCPTGTPPKEGNSCTRGQRE